MFIQIQSIYTCMYTQTGSYSSPLVVSQDTFWPLRVWARSAKKFGLVLKSLRNSLKKLELGQMVMKDCRFCVFGNSGSFWVLDDQLECLYHGRILAQQRKTKRKGSHAQRMISMNGTTWNLWGSSLDLLRARFDSRTVKRWYWSLQFRTRFCWNVGALCIWLDLNPDWIERISDQTYFQQNLGWGTSPILMSCDERDVKSPTKI